MVQSSPDGDAKVFPALRGEQNLIQRTKWSRDHSISELVNSGNPTK